MSPINLLFKEKKGKKGINILKMNIYEDIIFANWIEKIMLSKKIAAGERDIWGAFVPFELAIIYLL